MIIKTPRGQIFTIRTKDGEYRAQLVWDAKFADKRDGQFTQAQKFIDSECLRLSDPKVPMRTGMLRMSGKLGTVIGSGELVYVAPYARKMYYTHHSTDGRGRLWFERMKNEHKTAILAGVKRYFK